MAVTVTNAQVDTAAGNVAAGDGGPLTRVSDVEAYPTPNSEIRIELTTAAGNSVWLTYEQLTNAEQYPHKIAEADGISAIVEDIKTKVDALDTTMGAYSVPHTYAEYKATIESLREIAQIARL